METLEMTQKKHHAILQTIRQVESMLQPVFTGLDPKSKTLPGIPLANIERLAKHSDLLSNDFCSVKVENKHFEPIRGERKAKDSQVVSIEGENFGYSFEPHMVYEIQKRLNTKFKQAETAVKQAIKAARQMKAPAPAKEPVKQAKKGKTEAFNPVRKTREDLKPAIKADKQTETQAIKTTPRPSLTTKLNTFISRVKTRLGPKLLINKPARLKNKSVTETPKNKYTYICAMHDNSKYPVIINLIIKKKYFDQILSGEKTKEYRAPSKYNDRLLGFKDTNGKYSPRKDITHIRFINGYRANSPMLVAECKEIGCYTFVNEIPDGLKKGDISIEIVLGKVVEHS